MPCITVTTVTIITHSSPKTGCASRSSDNVCAMHAEVVSMCGQIKLRVEKSKEDREAEANRKMLLEMLNSSYE